MFRCPPTTTTPTSMNPSPNLHTKIDTNHRLCLKLTLSALIPLMIGVFTIVTTVLQQHDSRLLRAQSDRLADTLKKESVLVTYLNDISNLLMSANRTKVSFYIRTKTLTSLRQLDPDRKRYLLLYLYESDLLYQEPDQANTSALKIIGADLNGIQFQGTMYSKCAFVRLHLFDVYLSNTSFNNCYIDRSNFSYSKMSNAKFFQGRLIRVSFKFSLLENSCFCHMKLSTMNFRGAMLAGGNFTGANWEKGGVDFTNANLTGAILSDVQLRNSTLDNCILPNRTWGPIQRKNLVINGDLELQKCSSNDGQDLMRWSMVNGEFRVFPNENLNHTKCYFRIVMFNNGKNFAYLAQTLDLENFTLLISSGQARYQASASFRCLGSHYATMIIRHLDENGLQDAETVSGTHLQSLTFSNALRHDTRRVRILITTFRTLNETAMNETIGEDSCLGYNVKYTVDGDLFNRIFTHSFQDTKRIDAFHLQSSSGLAAESHLK